MFRKAMIIGVALLGILPTVSTAATPLAYHFFCAEHSIECQVSGNNQISLSENLELLQSVHSRINRTISPKAERIDEWKLYPRSGDCEDYALTKRSELRKKGIPTAAMSIGIFRLSDGQNHAVLVVNTDQGKVVLDNLSNDLYFKNQNMSMVQ